MIKVIMACAGLVCGSLLWAQQAPVSGTNGIPWLTPQEAEDRWKLEKRPFIIDIYTDWCHYCKVMDKSTWSNTMLGSYLSRHFYPIRFNAESKTTVQWMGKDYTYKTAYKVHMLAAEWCGGNMVYPTTVILVPGEEPVIIPGVLSVKELEPMLRYFGEGHYLTTEWNIFKRGFKNTWN